MAEENPDFALKRSNAIKYAISDHPRTKLYGQLLHVQIDLQEAAWIYIQIDQQEAAYRESVAAIAAQFEETERILCDEILDPLWKEIQDERAGNT